MCTTDEKGFMFSFDLLLAFFIMCAMLYFMLLNLEMIAGQSAGVLKEFSFYQNAFSFADSSVKSPLAFYDSEKRRVMDNVIDYALLKNVDLRKMKNVKFSIEAIALEYADGKKEIIAGNENKRGCSALERLVRVRKNSEEEEVAKISFLVCGAGK